MAEPGLVIRAATAEDCETLHKAIASLGQFVGASHKIECTPDDLRRHGFGPDPAFDALIAEIDGAFAGMCIYFKSFSTWLGRPGVYVQDIFVEERFRGAGVGEGLLRRVAELTRSQGGVYLRLSVDVGNDGARAFYERIGIPRSDKEFIHAAYGANFLLLGEPSGGKLTSEDER